MTRGNCARLSPFLAMSILEKAQELEGRGRHIIHLEIGQPDFETPPCIREAALRALRDGKTSYTHSLGILPLREGIAEYYLREYGVTVSPEQVLVTNGTSAAMLLLFSLLCGQGDEVITADPAYACYENFIRYTGAENIRVPAGEAENFQPGAEKVKSLVGARTRAILVNSPSNPAGTLLGREELRGLASLGPMLVSDEIYHGLVYEGRAVSALEISPDCCVLDGFSKRYAMTGWRVGWLIAPPKLMPALQTMQQNFFICANSISQWAALAALREADAEVEAMAAAYAERRLVLLEGLRSLGFSIGSRPAGAFYVLADARHMLQDRKGGPADSLALALDILEKAGVGLAPGIDFGPGAEGHLRFCYASSRENIEEAVRRLALYMERTV
ncbi:MAG: pyridoxal phosphate-dependent aminotransferase [Desulfovibrio sp.]|jgi:aspartate/methionine/tyrosine aminotransferase|nr:pyridoxal phosphate-dependent aminotransferase [Desulfovibrio sp.]